MTALAISAAVEALAPPAALVQITLKIGLLNTEVSVCQIRSTTAHHRDEKPERDLTYHLTCLLIYHGTTTHLL